jgi:signal transduction histidine kinase
MKARSLRAQLSTSILALSLCAVAVTCLLSGLLINREFKAYIASQASQRSWNIVYDLGVQFKAPLNGWDPSFLHTIGMYSLYDGYILKIFGPNGEMAWDAENHDMTLCGQIMDEISSRMEKMKNAGGFETHSFGILQGGAKVGSVSVTNYGPYFFSESDFRFIRSLNTALAIVGSIAAAFSVLIGNTLALRVSRPMAKAAYIAMQIAEGNYNMLFEGPFRTKELKRLAESVNLLSKTLSRQEELRKRLATDVAHELRTPLTAVGSHLEAMVDGLWEITPERLQGCHEEILRLGDLVKDLERLAKIEGDSEAMEKREVDLLALASSVAETFQGESAKKGLSLDVEGERAVVWADSGRMRQVVANLLSNAVKYTPEGGHIKAVVKDSPEGGVLQVQDDGIGIPEGEAAYVFERFYRTDLSRDRKTGGAGIGLAIARSIVSAHGGSIKAQSGAGGGSCFSVCIPKPPRLSGKEAG